MFISKLSVLVSLSKFISFHRKTSVTHANPLSLDSFDLIKFAQSLEPGLVIKRIPKGATFEKFTFTTFATFKYTTFEKCQ